MSHNSLCAVGYITILVRVLWFDITIVKLLSLVELRHMYISAHL